MRVDDGPRGPRRHIAENEHFEFFWVPHTGWALTKRNNRTDEPAPRGRWTEWHDDILMGNYVFGALARSAGCSRSGSRAGGSFPASGRTTTSTSSYRVFASPRMVRFYEMEYAHPRRPARRRSTGSATTSRTVAHAQLPDRGPLHRARRHPAGDCARPRQSATSPSTSSRAPVPAYFEASRTSWTTTAGGPHWGKLHFQTAATLAPRYPQWDRFQAMRARLDPKGRFANAYLAACSGSPERAEAGPCRRVGVWFDRSAREPRRPRGVTWHVAPVATASAQSWGPSADCSEASSTVDPLLHATVRGVPSRSPGRRRRTGQRGRRLRPTRLRYRRGQHFGPLHGGQRFTALGAVAQGPVQLLDGHGGIAFGERQQPGRVVLQHVELNQAGSPAPGCDVVEDRSRLLGPAGPGQELGTQQAAAGQADVVVALGGDRLTGIEGRRARLPDRRAPRRPAPAAREDRADARPPGGWWRPSMMLRWRSARRRARLDDGAAGPGWTRRDTTGARRRAGAGRWAAPRRGGPWPRRTRRA